MVQLLPPEERSPLPSEVLDGAWINAHRPPSREELTGSPTVIVRWNAGSLRSIADLHAAQTLSGAHAIGLHVPEHAREGRHRVVRNAVLREQLRLPIRHDPGGIRAETLGLTSTPSFAIVDPEGRLAASRQRSPHPTAQHLVDALDAPAPNPWPLRGDAPGPTTLLYPQGLDSDGNRLAVSDTGHHRLLLREADGTVHSIGTGAPGKKDGPFSKARFSFPRGVFLAEDELLVADTGNGALRRADLDRGRVETIVGPRELSGSDEDQPLPWDVLADPVDDGTIHVTLPTQGAIAQVSHASRAGMIDGLRSPTGIAADDERLFIAEPRPARILRLEPGGKPSPITPPKALLDHPVALAYADDVLFVADAYADAIHRVEPSSGTLLEPAPLPCPREPRAVTVHGEDVLTVGDDHRIVGSEGDRLQVAPLAPSADERTQLDPLEVAPDGDLEFEIVLRGVPEGSQVAMDPPRVHGPFRLNRASEPTWREQACWVTLKGTIPATGALQVSWSLPTESSAFTASWTLPVILRPGGSPVQEVRLSFQMPGRADNGRSP